MLQNARVTAYFFKSERPNVFTEETQKIIKSIDSIENSAYRTKKDLECKKEEIKYDNVIKNTKRRIKFYYIPKEDIKKQNLNWPKIPYYAHRILILGSSGSRKTNTFLNLIKKQDDDDYIFIDRNIWQKFIDRNSTTHKTENINILLTSMKIMILKI